MSTKPSFDCIENQQGSQGGAWLGESKYWKMNKLNKPENSRFGEREREPNLWSGATRAEKSLLIGNSALRPRYLMNTECTSSYHHTLKLISFLCFFNLLSLSFRSCSYIELSTDSLQVTFLRCVHRVGNIFQCKLSRFKGAVEVIKKPQVVWPQPFLFTKRAPTYHFKVQRKISQNAEQMWTHCLLSEHRPCARLFPAERHILLQNLLRDLDTVFLFTKTAYREKHHFFLYVFYLAIKEQVQLSLF